MSRLIYTGKYFDNFPLKHGSEHDVKIVYLPKEDGEQIIISVDDLYNKHYYSIGDFMRYWERPKDEQRNFQPFL